MSSRAAKILSFSSCLETDVRQHGSRKLGKEALDTALDGLMAHAKRRPHGEGRRVLSIGEKHSRPLNMACRLGSRPRYLPLRSPIS